MFRKNNIILIFFIILLVMIFNFLFLSFKTEYLPEFLTLIIDAFLISIVLIYFKNKNEKELEKEKNELQFLMENTNNAIHILNKNGDLVKFSTSFAKMLGYSNEEIKSFNVRDWDIFQKEEELKYLLSELLNNEVIIQTKIKRKDSSIIDVEIHAKGIELDGEYHVYATALDISNLIKLKDMTEIQSLAKISSWKLLPETQQLEVTDQFRKMYNIKHKKNVHLDEIRERIHKDDLEEFNRVINDLLNKPKIGVLNYRIINGNCVRYLYVTWNTLFKGDVFEGFYGYSQDVTEYKKLELELKQSNETYQSLFDNAPNSYFIIDKNQEILSANKMASINFLQDSHKSFSTYFYNILAGGYHSAFLNELEEVIKNKVSSDSFVLGMKHSTNLIKRYKAIILKHPIVKEHFIVSLIGIENELSAIEKEQETQNDLKNTISFLKSYQLAVDNALIVTKSDLEGNITYLNENFTNISGYTKKEALKQKHSIVRHPSNADEVFKDLWETIKSKKIWKNVLLNRAKDGSDYWVDTTILPILDANKEIKEYISVRYDITQTIKQKEELNKIANTDLLTGLGNRYRLINDIKSSKKLALAIINIDNFSQVNNFYGPEIGDYVIKEFGKAIEKLISNNSYILYHLQGDEFVLLGQNISKKEFTNKIEQLSNELGKNKITFNEDEITFGFTLALSFENKESILSTANTALKIAKRDNKNLVIYDNKISLNSEYENNILWAKKIKEGIIQDKFLPVFQPIVNNSNNSWEKYEALVRFEDEGKLISPYHFLELSKKTKHYTEITKIMIGKSFEKFKELDKEFSINLTIEDINNEDIKQYIYILLDYYKVGPRLVFEIVESESIENFEVISEFIKNVKTFGCKIAIDDFGTGYSNFEYLIKLNADYLKIDGSLIINLDTNKDLRVAVETIVLFAKSIGMKTVAEFVENETILKIVKEIGIDYSQGYYFSPPKKELI